MSSRSSAPAAASRPCIARPAERVQSFQPDQLVGFFVFSETLLALFQLPSPHAKLITMTNFADLTTIAVGGPIASFIEPTSRVGVIEAVEDADVKGLPLCVIGGGSNMLVADTPFNGVVVRDARRAVSVLDEAAPAENDEKIVHVNAEAGCNWDDFVDYCVGLGLEGVEGLSGIPGTVGASVVQNIGAYGQEVASSVESVEVWDRKDKQIKELTNQEIHDKVGIVQQRSVLFKGSIRDNMKWGNENASDSEIWNALKVAQAKEVVEGKDGQLDFMLEQNGKNLSGGQRQRLTIARALVKKPEILILDDSLSALDFATDAALRKALAGLEGETTTFLVSQRVAGIRQADKILVLDNGELAGSGTHDELMKSCEVYREIYFSQFPEDRAKYERGEM